MPKWDRYAVKIAFNERLIGGLPVITSDADPVKAYESWTKGQGVEPDDASDLAQALAAEGDMPKQDVAVEEIEGMLTGFRRDEDGLYIEARQIKAMIKESAQRLGVIVERRGSRQVLQHDLHVRTLGSRTNQKLHLGVAEPSGVDTRPISVVTRQGPRTALKRFEYVNQPTIEFEVRVLAGGVGVTKTSKEPLIGEEQLAEILDNGQDLGIGSDRSQGEGTFTLLEFSKIPEEEA